MRAALTILLLLLLPSAECRVCQNYDAVSWLDMFGWVSAGKSPRWEVTEGGRTVTQYINSPYPGFYVSDKDDLINVVLSGTIAVLTEIDDDDMIGIAMGYHAPMPGNLSVFDNLLFSWGGHGGMFSPHDSATIQRLDGVVDFDYSDGGHGRGTEGTCFFSRNPDPTITSKLGCFTPLPATDITGGWEPNQVYTFSVLFTEEVFYVNVDGQRKVSITKAELFKWCDDKLTNPEDKKKCKSWKKGKMAFYNYSQNGVRYGNVKIFNVNATAAGSAPHAGNDIYTVSRTANQQGFETLNVPTHEGLLVNDYSPDLDKLVILVNGTEVRTNQDIETTEGGMVTLMPNGALTYQAPDTASVTDTFTYAVRVSPDRDSTPATVTFSLPPPTSQLSGFSLLWNEEHSTDVAWYRGLQVGTIFGTVEAEGGCGLIADWKLLSGGEQGRFTLVANPQHGASVSVADPTRVKLVEQEQVFTLEAEATDVFKQTATVTIRITIPSSGCAQCPVHSTCTVSYECVCDEDYAPPECTTYCPGGDCNNTTMSPPVPTGGETDSCGSFLVNGDCIGWLIILLIVFMVLLCIVFAWAYMHRGRKTVSKKKGAKLKSYEIDQRMLEDETLE